MREHWLIPCNVRYFDIVDHFKKNNTVVWKKQFALRKNDVIYIYVSKPYQEIMFMCHVIDDNVDNDILKQNTYAIRQDATGKKGIIFNYN